MKMAIDCMRFSCDYVQPNEPTSPIEGQTWFNTSSNKKFLYKATINKWYEFDFGKLNSSGYIMGGISPSYHSSLIEKVDFNSDSGNARISGNLNKTTIFGGSCNSSTHAFYISGDTSTIERFSFDLNSIVTTVGICSFTRRYSASLNSSLAGYSSDSGIRNKFIFPFDLGSSVINLSDSNPYLAQSSFNSSNHGYFCNGENSSSVSSNTVYRMPFSIDSSCLLVGTLATSTDCGNGMNSSIHGFSVGGNRSGSYLSTIDRIVFPFDSGTGTMVGTTLISADGIACCNSTTIGLLCGGNNNSTICRINFPFDSGISTAIGRLNTLLALGTATDNTDFVSMFI